MVYRSGEVQLGRRHEPGDGSGGEGIEAYNHENKVEPMNRALDDWKETLRPGCVASRVLPRKLRCSPGKGG